MKDSNSDIFVICGPSGVGKTTLTNLLLSRFAKMGLSVSWTTRKLRAGEIHGKDYFFVSEAELNEKVAKREMLEWANVYGHFYGTPFDFVKEKMAIGEDVLLDIDVQGAYQVKKRLPHAVLIFILPPSWEELKRRLLTRSADSAQAIKTRLKAAKKEIELAKNFDYIVINNTLENTLDELESIIHATKAKAIKHGKMIEELIKITPF